jgi:hypothetical protein
MPNNGTPLSTSEQVDVLRRLHLLREASETVAPRVIAREEDPSVTPQEAAQTWREMETHHPLQESISAIQRAAGIQRRRVEAELLEQNRDTLTALNQHIIAIEKERAKLIRGNGASKMTAHKMRIIKQGEEL